ncbi:MAG: hypothetical protein O7C67_02095 [Gammaproteobacteria bacterium]|nr:hypothetical protein [Gammaproteobacteria bacterium]MCZ6656062.1 hypothetical protein [Gammaproteobacteria bacterium]
MFKLIIITIALLALHTVTVIEAVGEELPRFVSIHLVTQLKEDGVLGPEINVVDFACVDGRCWMDTIVINRCVLGTQAPISFHSTTGGSVNDVLEVSVEDDLLLVEEEGGDVKAQYQFRLSKQRSPGTDIRTRHVTDFFGYYVKESRILNRDIQIEYVRLTDYPIRVELACPIEYFLR